MEFQPPPCHPSIAVLATLPPNPRTHYPRSLALISQLLMHRGKCLRARTSISLSGGRMAKSESGREARTWGMCWWYPKGAASFWAAKWCGKVAKWQEKCILYAIRTDRSAEITPAKIAKLSHIYLVYFLFIFVNFSRCLRWVSYISFKGVREIVGKNWWKLKKGLRTSGEYIYANLS